jgi:hypothetical protein
MICLPFIAIHSGCISHVSTFYILSEILDIIVISFRFRSYNMSNKAIQPQKWPDVYPHGCKAGDEEQDFWIALARNQKWQWRSVAAIAKESGLSKERVEELLNKYWKKGMIFQNPQNDDQWGYWERVPQMLPKSKRSVADDDHHSRIDKAK